ncbi:hypothetical protein [Fluoribacter gormanii]|uniref:Uncharacterized protein n=1 Tax=Fluoribacter gormanii TaxID=464 RepID=A0A377GIX5_9GAMM|nr:hypothetical protein [Fluoribacter gormanii]KTD03475.1 hypothetical protein Lgor_1460 [Fluoribacter gormanii]SIQ47049.1 hypothetical protein SAMN05421777_101102 [Fluoribacter gormanii]STO24503.1 Uncharacterised protein [Fluoribacter gormanii]
MINNSELEIIICFMYVNADFFAAPFLNRDKFSSWVGQKEDVIKFSTQLHEALETSKPISINNIDLLKAFRVAIVGASVLKTGEFSKRNCLLTGYSTPLLRVLMAIPRLASTIKSHMNSNLFDNWYNTQSPKINNKRNRRLEKLDLLTKKLDHDFELYQAKKLKKIHLISPVGVSISHKFNGNAVSNYKDGAQKPTEIIIEDGGDSDLSELRLLVDKFNLAQSVRETLRNPKVNPITRLKQFSDIIQDKNFIATFTEDNDSDGMRLLKTVAYALTTLVFGLGLYLSYKNKGTCKFWTSGEEELLESTNEKFDMEIIRISNPKVWGK